LGVIRGVFRGGGVGGQPPPLFWKNFFNLLGFFEKKILKPLPKFFRPYKKISKPPLKKISGYAPGGHQWSNDFPL